MKPQQPSACLVASEGLRSIVLLSVVVAGLVAGACVSGGGPPSSVVVAPESVWQRLNRPRPQPLSDAPRIIVAELVLLGSVWPGEYALSPSIGLGELVAAGLIRRRDVQFVERRRFAAAVAREAQGLPRPRNAPRTGVSPGAELQLAGSWIPAGDSATLDLRLVDVETSAVVAGWRTTTPRGIDPTAVARTIVGSTVSALRGLGRVPVWSDPLEGDALDPAPTAFTLSGVVAEAVAAFFRGVEAEDRFQWEQARRGYQGAMEMGGSSFFEPDVALARVARLRAGGALGASDR